MDGGSWSRLSCNDSLAVSADIDRKNIVSMTVLLNSLLVLGNHFALVPAIETLLASLSVHHYTECCDHVYSLAFGSVSPR